MAINPREVTVSRDDVQGWLTEWVNTENRPPVKEFLASKLKELGLSEAVVDTVGHDDLGDETPLLEMIYSDLPSYGFKELSS